MRPLFRAVSKRRSAHAEEMSLRTQCHQVKPKCLATLKIELQRCAFLCFFKKTLDKYAISCGHFAKCAYATYSLPRSSPELCNASVCPGCPHEGNSGVAWSQYHRNNRQYLHTPGREFQNQFCQCNYRHLGAKKGHSEHFISECPFKNGAANGNRTRTVFGPRDFKC